jgi:hypothetical protein
MMCKKTKVLLLKKRNIQVLLPLYASTPKPVAAARHIVRGKPSEPSIQHSTVIERYRTDIQVLI